MWYQWSFRNTGTMGTVASETEIGVWVQAPGMLLRKPGGITHGKKIEIVYEKACNLVHFGRKMVRNAVHNAFLKHFNSGNIVSTRSPSK